MPQPASSPGIALLLAGTGLRVFAALLVGALLWASVPMFVRPAAIVSERFPLLLLVVANQWACLLIGIQWRPRNMEIRRVRSFASALVAGVLGVLLAILFGLVYDEILRRLFAAAPTIGTWGAARQLPSLPSAGIVVAGVCVGPVADELFFRRGVFRVWADAGAPGLGAVLSSVLFALSRLDIVNFVAYGGLGLLLCGVYQRSGMLVAPWTTHVLLNLAMFLLLFLGYQ
jgi:membrane protease YdiL (CAAX protease family)